MYLNVVFGGYTFLENERAYCVFCLLDFFERFLLPLGALVGNNGPNIAFHPRLD